MVGNRVQYSQSRTLWLLVCVIVSVCLQTKGAESMSSRIVIRVALLLVVGVVIGVLAVMVLQSVHVLTPTTPPVPHMHW